MKASKSEKSAGDDFKAYQANNEFKAYPAKKFLFSTRLFEEVKDGLLINRNCLPMTTPYRQAEILSTFLAKQNLGVKKIIDLTANIGGNLYSISKHFPDLPIFAYEENKETFEILKNNMKVLGVEAKLFNQDSSEVDLTDALVLFDPPWGIDYKKHKIIEDMKFGKTSVMKMVKSKNCVLVMKLPSNFISIPNSYKLILADGLDREIYRNIIIGIPAGESKKYASRFSYGKARDSMKRYKD